MYYVYLYSDKFFKRNLMQYGYWSGKQYICKGECFPVCSENKDEQTKVYTSIKRANNGGMSSLERFVFVTGYDVEDEKGNILFKSYQNKVSLKNNSGNSQKKEDKPVEYIPEEKEQPACWLVRIGTNIELKMQINGVYFYTHKKFATVDEATEFAERQGLEIVCNT